jgi:Glycosyltransferase family 17
MLVDCFTYFEERELLLLRYEILKDVVDAFLVTDANLTFRGDPKPYNCLKHLTELGITDDRIQVLHVELPPKEEILDPWIREYAQRDALSVGMRMCPPDTIFYLSDVDEIPRPHSLLEAADLVKQDPSRCARLSMPMFYSRGDLRVVNPAVSQDESPNNWVCGTVFHFDKLELPPSQIRRIVNKNDVVVGQQDAGWHFSWMGDKNRLKAKLQSFSHCYDDIPNAVAPSDSQEMLDYIDNYVPASGSPDILGRHDHILTPYSHELLPPEAFRLETVKNFLFPQGN